MELEVLAAVGQERVEVCAGWHGGLCAAACYGDGGCGAGESRGGERVFTFEQCDGESSVEAIAGGDRIDGVNGKGLDPACCAARVSDVCAFGAAFEYDAAEAACEQFLRSDFGIGSVVEVEGGFGFVRSEPRELFPGGIAESGCRCGIEHDGNFEFGTKG